MVDCIFFPVFLIVFVRKSWFTCLLVMKKCGSLSLDRENLSLCLSLLWLTPFFVAPKKIVYHLITVFLMLFNHVGAGVS